MRVSAKRCKYTAHLMETILAKRKSRTQSRWRNRLSVLSAALMKSIYPIDCEGQGNALYFCDLPVAGTNDGGHGSSGIAVAFSNHRNGTHFRHHFIGRRDFDSGPALDGIDVS